VGPVSGIGGEVKGAGETVGCLGFERRVRGGLGRGVFLGGNQRGKGGVIVSGDNKYKGAWGFRFGSRGWGGAGGGPGHFHRPGGMWQTGGHRVVTFGIRDPPKGQFSGGFHGRGSWIGEGFLRGLGAAPQEKRGRDWKLQRGEKKTVERDGATPTGAGGCWAVPFVVSQSLKKLWDCLWG